MLAIALTLCVPAAEAEEWQITPSITIGESFTDNVDLEEDNEQSDFITTVRPGIAINGSGPRVALNLDYSVEGLYYAKDPDRSEFLHHLGADGQAELVEDFLFLDAQAFITQALISNSDAQSIGGVTDSQNRTNVYGYNFGPSLRHSFHNWANLETRYTLRQTIFGTDEVSDNLTNQGTVNVASGKDFARFLWDATLNGEVSERSDSESTERQLAVGTIQYVVVPAFIPLASFGYERIIDDSLSEEPNGPIGAIGLRSLPNPRMSMQLTAGWRFDRPNVGFDFAYEPGPQTTLTASYSEGIETTARLAGEALDLLAVDEDGNFIDLNRRLPFELISTGFSLSDDAFFRRRGEVTIVGSSGRNHFYGLAYGETRETDVTGVTERSIGGRMNYSRDISRRTTVSVTASYINTDFGTEDDRVDNLFGLRADVSYRVSENAIATLDYARTLRVSTEKDQEYAENFVSLQLRLHY